MNGIGEARPLDFHSPYGCSKGTADQYVLDYARTFGLPAVVFRMSCIYGPHQFGTEDQGWVAHFLIRALQGEPITLYGDGMQVRDILFVEDLVDAFLLAQAEYADDLGPGIQHRRRPRQHDQPSRVVGDHRRPSRPKAKDSRRRLAARRSALLRLGYIANSRQPRVGRPRWTCVRVFSGFTNGCATMPCNRCGKAGCAARGRR